MHHTLSLGPVEVIIAECYPIPMKVLVAIPCYNCEKQISRVLAGFDETLLSQIEEVVCFDNGSKDQTPEAALQAIRDYKLSKIKVVANNDNYGLGGSQKLAFSYARQNKMDYLVVLHGDNQAVTSELKNFLEAARKKPELDAVLGSRFMPGSKREGYSTIRVLGNNFFNILYGLFWFRYCWDMGSGLNIFKVSAVDEEDLELFNNGFTFNMDLLLHLFSSSKKIKYLPITWMEHDQVSNARNLSVGLQTLKILFKWRFFPFLKKREISKRSFTELANL
ncbi:MAG: glycosyltransferase family 2 protein [Halobacteriovoraceae bacterium]|nr:glycosyltransferase family 2 protein [Halobacteriovoraceae bacterium]